MWYNLPNHYFEKPSKIQAQARRADNGWQESKVVHGITVAALLYSR